MDQDLVMNRLVSGLIALAVALVLGAIATWLVGVVCRRMKLPGGLVVLAQLLTPVALVYAASLYLDAAGVVAPSQVASKDESITYSSRIPGGWNRFFWATVRFASPEGPTEAMLWLDEASFDALSPGTALDVRFVSWFPHIARPASESTRSLVPWRWLVPAAAAIGAGVALWLLLRRRAPGMMALTFFVAIAGGVVWWVFPTPWDTPPVAPLVTTMAEVRGVRTVTRSFVSGRSTGPVEAPQPWEVVELHFVPDGRSQVVVAVDGVDVGSVPGLTVGARVLVSYNASDPRNARLPGTRTYRWREWLELGEYVVAGIVVVIGFVLLGKLASFWWRKLTQRS